MKLFYSPPVLIPNECSSKHNKFNGDLPTLNNGITTATTCANNNTLKSNTKNHSIDNNLNPTVVLNPNLQISNNHGNYPNHNLFPYSVDDLKDECRKSPCRVVIENLEPDMISKLKINLFTELENVKKQNIQPPALPVVCFSSDRQPRNSEGKLPDSTGQPLALEWKPTDNLNPDNELLTSDGHLIEALKNGVDGNLIETEGDIKVVKSDEIIIEEAIEECIVHCEKVLDDNDEENITKEEANIGEENGEENLTMSGYGNTNCVNLEQTSTVIIEQKPQDIPSDMKVVSYSGLLPTFFGCFIEDT